MTPDEWEEVKFLRYFYEDAGTYMGPADGDIYRGMKEWYRDNIGPLPKGEEYALYDEDEDEECES
jgi:hypothetical protein